MSEHHEEMIHPEEKAISRGIPAGNDEERAELGRNMLAQLKRMIPVLFGLSNSDPNTIKEKLLQEAMKLIQNPGQFSEDFWDSLFGTGRPEFSGKATRKRRERSSLRWNFRNR